MADRPSNERRISVAWVHNQIGQSAPGFNMTRRAAAAALHRRRVAVLHPTGSWLTTDLGYYCPATPRTWPHRCWVSCLGKLLSLRRQSEKVLKASPSAAQNAGWVCPLCSKRCRISRHCSAERRVIVRLPVKLMGSPVNLLNKEEQGNTDQRWRI